MVTAGAAAAGLVFLTKRSMENMDAIAKLSDRIGVSTEFLSAFGHEAKIAGTSSEAFNKSIEIFVRRLGELTQGTGQAKYGLDALGLTTTELLNMSTEDAFLKVADGIRNLGTQAEKAAVAYRFFGRSGSQMLNLLEGDLSGVIARAKELGITFDRDAAAKIERANDAITRMKSAFEGVGNTIAIAVSPMIETAAEQIAEMAAGTNSVQRIKDSVKDIAIGVTYIAEAFNLVFRSLEKVVGLSLRLMAISTVIPSAIMDKLGFKGTASLIDEVGSALYQEGGDLLSKPMGIGEMLNKINEFFDTAEKRSYDIGKITSSGLYDGIDEEVKKKSLGDASSRQIRSSLVSVTGLSTGGVIDKQDTTNQLLQEQNRILRELGNNIRMN
jgi:hypothetical protein